jgi:predicted peptidase
MKHVMSEVAMSVMMAIGAMLITSCCSASGAGKSEAAQTAAKGFVFKAVTVGGVELKYAVYVPRTYAAGKPMPAVVFLHGSGECGSDGQKMIAQGVGTNILWNAGRWPCIVVMPQKPVEHDQWEKYDAQVMAALEATRREYSVDPKRIALTGLSQGGHGTWAIGAAHPDLWCALAPICGYADAHHGGITPAEIAAKVKGIPVWAFHGADDDVVPPEQTKAVIAALKSAGGAGPEMGGPRLTIYPNTNHGSWDKAYSEGELPGFLMTARR